MAGPEDLDSYEKEEVMFSPKIFERWYNRQLDQDAKREPRPVNPDDYHPKKFKIPASGSLPTWQSLNEKED